LGLAGSIIAATLSKLGVRESEDKNS
jgi:hypothetical protein